MKPKAFAIIGLAHIFVPIESYAYTPQPYYCNTSYSNSEYADTITIDTLVIPGSLPEGSIVWRQPEQELGYSCYRGSQGFEPSLYLNELSIVASPDLELGITFDGKDYRPSSMANKQVPTGHWIPAKDGSTINETKRFKLSLFLIKRARTKTGDNETVKLPSKFTALSIGKDGTPFKYVLDILGMNNTSQIPCTSTVSITPSTINFGNISTFDAFTEKEIKRVPFSIVEQRTCEKPTIYGLNGYLRPLDNSYLMDSLSTLVPRDNNSVGINIFETDGNKNVVFNKEFVISPKTDTTSYSKQFEARLKWRTNRPKLGEFNAGAILDVYYK